jgi:hypothetical protein
MIDHKAFVAMKNVLAENKQVLLRAEFNIARPDNSVDLGVFWGSSLDLTILQMNELALMVEAHKVTKTTADTLLSLHVHTFACPNCPKSIKEDECVSDGAYCTFFPKMGDMNAEDLDPEDKIVKESQTCRGIMADFTGRDLLISSLYEKCSHSIITKVPGRKIYTEKDWMRSML